MEKYDCIVIGTGQSGPPLAAALADEGRTVAIIEKGEIGGSCVNEGCTPTKAYIADARRAHVARTGAQHGISFEGELKVNLKTIKARKDRILEDKHRKLREMWEDNERIDFIAGEARFTGPHTVEVPGRGELRAEQIFVNVGGHPRIPEAFRDVDFLTNRTILDLETIPDHLIIVGGGYIGLEFGQMFRRFGSRVTIIEQGRQLLQQEDPDIGRRIFDILENEGCEIILGAESMHPRHEEGGIAVSFEVRGKSQKVEGSKLLLAVGREPNTSILGLDRAGVQLDDRGYIEVDGTLRTNVEHIWALGDCNGHGGFTHTSYNDFQIVHSQLFGDGRRTLDDRIPCYAAFLDPALARVGLNRTQILEKGLDAKVAEMPMNEVARAIEKGETDGVMRIFIDANTDRILGATFLGTEADEYIHVIIDAMYGGVKYQVIRDAMHIHPTVSELIPTMLENLTDLGSGSEG